MENPRNGLLKTREYMQNIPYTDAEYCQYTIQVHGTKIYKYTNTCTRYKKPTRFWGSPGIEKLQLRLCDRFTCPNAIGKLQPNGQRKHRITLSSPHVNIYTHLKYRIPVDLNMELGGFATPLPRGVRKRKKVATVNQFEETDPQKSRTGPRRS